MSSWSEQKKEYKVLANILESFSYLLLFKKYLFLLYNDNELEVNGLFMDYNFDYTKMAYLPSVFLFLH